MVHPNAHTRQKRRDALRRKNLHKLVDEADGSLTVVAKRCKIGLGHLHQMLNAKPNNPGSEKVRRVTDRSASKLEAGMGKPPGWMDLDDNGSLFDAVVASDTMTVLECKAPNKALMIKAWETVENEHPLLMTEGAIEQRVTLLLIAYEYHAKNQAAVDEAYKKGDIRQNT